MSRNPQRKLPRKRKEPILLAWCVISIAPVLFFAALAAPVPTGKPASYPAWWFEREVVKRTDTNVSNPTWPTNYLPADDYAVLNAGQLKLLASRAFDELQEKLPASVWQGGANAPGVQLSSLVNAWRTNTASGDPFSAVNQGQIKAVAKHFYDVLAQAGYVAGHGLPPSGWTSGAYPWSASTNAPDAYAAANIGQAKHLFSFDLTVFSSDGDTLPDYWENAEFGNLDSDGEGDFDSDGRTNLEEFQQGTDPQDFFNGQPAVLEIVSGNNQGDLPGTTLANPYKVRVSNQLGTPKSGATVTFTIQSQSGGGQVTPASTTTDASGIASASLQLPTTVGATILTQAAFGTLNVTFTATVGNPNAAPSATLAKPFVSLQNGDTEARIDWTDTVNNETNFQVQRTEDGAAWTPLTTLPANSTSYTDTGLTAGHGYYYRIVTLNGTGNTTSASGGAAVDSDGDGLTNDDEADYNLDPNNTDTDGDGTNDGLDGWAGNREQSASNAAQAQLAPPRLPVTRYALVDFGPGSGGKLNQKGDMLYYSGAASWVFLNGQKIQIPNPGLSSYSAWDINEAGDIMGGGSSGTETRLFKWTQEQGGAVLEPFGRYQLEYDIQNQKTFIYAWPGLTASGEIWALQAYYGGKSGTSPSGYVNYNADFHDLRFGNLKSQPLPNPYSPSYIAYEEFIQGSYNGTGNPPNPNLVPQSENFYLNTRRSGGSGTNYYSFRSRALASAAGDKHVVARGSYSGGSWSPSGGGDIGIWQNGTFTAISDTQNYNPLRYNYQGDIFAIKDTHGHLMTANTGYSQRILVPRFGAFWVNNINAFNSRLQVLIGSTLWQNHRDFALTDLCSELGEGGSFTEFSPADINDKGLISGTAKKLSDNTMHAVLLIPVGLVDSKDGTLDNGNDVAVQPKMNDADKSPHTVAWIDPHGAPNETDPEMPWLVLRVWGAEQMGLKIKWKLKVEYKRPNGRKLDEDKIEIPDASGWVTESLDGAVEVYDNIKWTNELTQKGFFGGDAELTFQLLKADGSALGEETKWKFYIGGKNTDDAKTKTFITETATSVQQPMAWFVYAIAKHESQGYNDGVNGQQDTRYNQFWDATGRFAKVNHHAGEVLWVDNPREDPPKGFGMFQVTGNKSDPSANIPRKQLWNWQENVKGGLDIIASKRGIADRYFARI